MAGKGTPAAFTAGSGRAMKGLANLRIAAGGPQNTLVGIRVVAG